MEADSLEAPAQAIHVAGTGSLAADVVEIARDAGHEVGGLIELMDAERVGTTIHGLPVVAVEQAPEAGAPAVLGAGGDRAGPCALLEAHGWRLQAVVHPTAHVPPSVRIGAGAVVGPGVVLGAGASVGRGAQVSRGALVGHHTRIEELATLNPGVNVAGNSVVGRGAFLGLGCLVSDHVRVGAGAVVAAGAVVVRDVPPGLRVQGVPARAFEAETAR
jgi:sugar O-acyltransferase (sialic acid O-acetyltransferase NeuD family)